MLASPPREQELQSGIFEIPRAPGADNDRVRVENAFIEAWARMAGAFAMDATMGRIHALIYLSSAAIDESAIGARLGYAHAVIELHLATLVEWKLVHRSGRGYVAEQDPWTWFANTIRARQRREFLPIRDAIESVRDAARSLNESASGASAKELRLVVARIDRFASFVCDIAKLVDAFVTLGAAPMLKFASMTTRFVPRRAA